MVCDVCGVKMSGSPEVSEVRWGGSCGIGDRMTLSFCGKHCQFDFLVDLHERLMPGASRREVLAHVRDELGLPVGFV